MEDRTTPTVTSSVVGGILTVNGTFNDGIVVQSQGGLVQVNGADPGSGAALSSTILSIVVSPGAGSNTVDLRHVVAADFPNLLTFDINGSSGPDTYWVTPDFYGSITTGNQASRIIVKGSATDVALNEAGMQLVSDTRVITLLGNAYHLSLEATIDNLTINPAAGASRTLTDDAAANDGISRLYDNLSGRTVDFKNPTASFTVRDLNAPGNGSQYRFQGLDSLGTPADIQLDANNRADTLTFASAATNVVLDEANSRVVIDGFVIGIPNSSASNLKFTGTTANLTFLPTAASNRTLRDDGTANDGVSRLFNNSNGGFIDFKNPTASLTLRNATGAGGSIYDFLDLDALGTPAAIAFDAANQADQFRFTRNSATAIYDQAQSLASLGGFTVDLQNASAANLLFDATFGNFTMLPRQGTSILVTDDGAANDGISRLTDLGMGTLVAFRNPTTLAIRDTHALGGSEFDFRALDASNAPANIILDAGGHADLLKFTFAASDVVADLRLGEVWLDGLTVKTPNASAANFRFDIAMDEFALSTPLSDHRIVQDDGIDGDGISRMLNPTSGKYVDFRNPVDLVTVIDENAGGSSKFEFVTLDSFQAPTDIDLDFGTNSGTAILRVPGIVGSVTEDRDAGIIDIDNWSVGVFGDGPNKIVLDMQMAALAILPDADDMFVISDNAVPNDGISRGSSTIYGTTTDFRNPIGVLFVGGANGVGGSIYEFNGLDAVSRPQLVELAVLSAVDLFRFTGKATTVIDDLDNDSITIDGLQIDLCGCGVDVFLDMDMANLTFILPPGEGWTISDDGIPNNGVSRLEEDGSPYVNDFRNPSAKLAVVQDGGSWGEFQGLDAVGKPAIQDMPLDSLSKLREEYGFRFAGSYYTSFAGQNEKWFQDRTGKWYAIFPTGRLAEWNGGVQFTTIANVAPAVHQNPQLLFQATVTLSTADLNQLDLIQQANGFRFAGSYWENYLGLREKWFKNQGGQWHVILPNGDIKAWLGGNSLGAAIATVNAFVCDDPSVLFRAGLAPAVVQQLQLVQQANGFRFMTSFYENYLGLGEKWFVDRNGAWHVIVANGDISKRTGNSLTFVANVDPAAYVDPWLLLLA